MDEDKWKEICSKYTVDEWKEMCYKNFQSLKKSMEEIFDFQRIQMLKKILNEPTHEDELMSDAERKAWYNGDTPPPLE